MILQEIDPNHITLVQKYGQGSEYAYAEIYGPTEALVVTELKLYLSQFPVDFYETSVRMIPTDFSDHWAVKIRRKNL